MKKTESHHEDLLNGGLELVKKFDTLFQQDSKSSRLNEWSVRVLETPDKIYVIRTSHGIAGGKKITSDVEIREGKNLGRKNQTSPKEQALFEAESDFKKKIKRGYQLGPPQHEQEEPLHASKKKDDGSPQKSKSRRRVIKPMLAHEFKLDETPLRCPVFIQTKLDGVRCLIWIDDEGNIVFQSRNNTIFQPFEHIIDDARRLLSCMQEEHPEKIVLDGELYRHGFDFSKITSTVRRMKTKHPDLLQLQFYVYDWFNLDADKNREPYSERYLLLRRSFEKICHELRNIIFTETKEASNRDEILKLHQLYTSLPVPFEGIIIRSPGGIYKNGGRSRDLLKYKTFHDAEFLVLGYEEGKGLLKETPVFICQTNSSPIRTFNVVLRGSIQEKKEIFQKADDYKGKMITVKFQSLSEDGVPRFPVGIGFRDFEGDEDNEDNEDNEDDHDQDKGRK